MKPPSPTMASTAWLGRTILVAIALGSPAPMVASALSSSRLLGRYAGNCRAKYTCRMRKEERYMVSKMGLSANRLCRQSHSKVQNQAKL